MIARWSAWLDKRMGAGTGREWLAVGGVLLLALALRLARLDFQPLWWDEGWSVYFATAPVGQMLDLTSVDIHPPLYYGLLQLWIGIWGPASPALRSLSVLIGLAAIPALYLAGRRLWGARAGLLAALLLAVSPLHIFYSQEVRMYGLVMLLGLSAFYFALDWLPGSAGPRRRAWAGYVLAAAAALYTQYYAALLLLALNAVVLAGCWRRGCPRGRLWGWLGAQAAVAALYVPWLLYAGGRLLSYVQYKVGADRDLPLGLLTYLGRHLAALGWGHAEGALAGWWWLGLLPPAALAAAGLWLVAGRRSARGVPLASLSAGEGRGSWAVWACLAVAGVLLAAGYGINLVFPFNPARSERLLLPALPACLLLGAAVLGAQWSRRRTAALLLGAAYFAAALLSLGFFYGTPRYPDDDYRPVADRLRALARPGDVVVAVHPWQVGYLYAYWPDATTRPRLVLSPREVLPRERQLWADDPSLMAAELDALLAEHVRLWLPAHQAMGRVLEGRLEAYLTSHAYPALGEWYGESTLLYLFAAGEPAVSLPSAPLSDWLALGGGVRSDGPLYAGEDVLLAELSWRVVGPVPPDAGRYRVSLRLVDAAGRVWAQRDSRPLGGLGSFAAWPADASPTDRHGLRVPAGVPPGDYQVALRVYPGRDVDGVPWLPEGESSTEVRLGAVRVERARAPLPPEALTVDPGVTPLDVDFGPLRLLGARFGTGTADYGWVNGEPAEIELYWQALAAPGQDYMPRLEVVDRGGRVLAELVEKPVAGAYPTAWWQAGELVRDRHSLVVPAGLGSGSYRLRLGVIEAATGSPLGAGRRPRTVDLGEFPVAGRDGYFYPPAPRYAQVSAVGQDVELAGYDLDGPEAAADGRRLWVTLYWHALNTPAANYDAFVHLLDAQDRIVAQDDGVPGGNLFTRGWLPGEYLADPHTLPLPPDLPPGEYRLAVGLYDPVTQQRLGERVLLAETVSTNHDR